MAPTDLTIEILKSIREEGRKTNARLDETNARLATGFADVSQRIDALSQRVDGLETETVKGFVAVTARLENLRDFAGERYREHEERVRRVEGRLDRIEGTRGT